MSDRQTDHGNGHDNPIGKAFDACELGRDCPFEKALHQLEDEQHQRIRSEAALATALDGVANKAQQVYLDLEKVQRALRDFTHEFEKHLRQHRYLDLAVISAGAAIGGFIAKLIVQ